MLVSSVIPTFLSNSDEFTNDFKEDRMTSLLKHNEAEPNEYTQYPIIRNGDQR